LFVNWFVARPLDLFYLYRTWYWSFITPITDIISGSTFRFFAFLSFGTDSEWTRENAHALHNEGFGAS
jgi:hypothetical protein